MEFNLGKTAEEIHQRIKHIFSNDKSTKSIDEVSLTASESEELNEGLSGEYTSSGFTETESEELLNGLSGAEHIEYLTIDSDGQTKSVTFYGDKREGFLELTPDSLQFYIDKYTNIAKAYIKNGIVTLLDSNNSPILDSTGKPITVDYNQASQSNKIDLVSFYLNHLNGELDVNKMFELQELQDKINSTPEADKNYAKLQAEIEVQKFEMMNEKERKNYMSAKMWNAFNKGDKTAWFNALNEFYEYECRMIDKKFGITGTKEFLKDKTHFNDLIAYIDKTIDNANDKLTKTELMWEIIKGIGDTIDTFIGTQGLTMMGILGAGTKAVTSIPKIGPVLGGAIQAYFGTEGATLIGSGMIDGVSAETKDQARQAGAEIGLGGIMAKGGSKSFIEGFKGLEIKAFRKKISEISTLDDLTTVREMIEELPYSKAEKQMLQNECTKQQGKIQGVNTNNTSFQPSIQGEERIAVDASTSRTNAGKGSSLKNKLHQQKVRSQVAYALFKICKTPMEREMAKLLLSDSRLYMALKDKTDLLYEFRNKCEHLEDINVKKQFVYKMLENPNLLDEKGVFNEYIMQILANVDNYSIDFDLSLLEEYRKTGSKLKGRAFSYLMLSRYADDANALEKFLNNKNIDFDKLNNYSDEEIKGIFYIIKESKNDYFGAYSKISLEDIKNNYNLRTIASSFIRGGSANDIRYIRDVLLVDKTLQENPKPAYITYKGTDYNYSELIKELLEHLSKCTNIYSKHPAAKLYSDVILDSELGKNYKALKSLFSVGGKDYCNVIFNALKNGVESLSNDELRIFFEEFDYDNYGDFIQKFINNRYKPIEGKIIQEDIIGRILINNQELIKDFTTNRTYTDKELNLLMINTYFDYKKGILADLCKQQEYSAKNIFTIMNHTMEHSVDLTKKILGTNTLTAKEKVDLIVALDVSHPQLENLVSVLIQQENLDIRTIPKILDAIKILDEHDAGGNNGKVDPKKLDRYLRLIQNPKTSPWVIQMLNLGWDIETISKLSPTKQAFYIEKLNNKKVEIKDKNVQFFMDFGLEVKEAEAIVKAISQNGILNTEMQKTAVDLINAGIPKNHVGQILNSATITGEYNSRIPADAMALKDLGLNAFVERYLPIVNNLSPSDIAVKFNPKMKKQLISMIENIPEDTKPALRAKGFDLEGAITKLKTEVKRTTNRGKKGEIQNGFRSKSSLTGFEKIVVDKYEPIAKIWRSPDATKKWAEEKYQSIKNGNYLSIRNTEQTKVEEVNNKRTERLKAWFEFMDSEAEVKDNPFIKVLLSEFITKNLLPENSATPPAFDKSLAKKVLSEALKSGEAFDKAYIAEMNSSAKKFSSTMEVELGGRKMTWYTVPKTDSSHPDFKTNVAKVQAFSDGTNWCIRTWNAEPYIQKGNIHFLVDETGLTQVCIREGEQSGFKDTKFKGQIAEIQKRQQAGDIPVAYVDFIQDFVTKKGLKGCESGIKKAIEQKPQFDITRNKLQKYANKKDYKSILEMMGIDVKVLPDGSWEISHYTSYLNDIALNDYGIKENELLANVSKIKCNANFKDSNATSLPNLKEVEGDLNFGYSEISNLKKLEKIKNKQIKW